MRGVLACLLALVAACGEVEHRAADANTPVADAPVADAPVVDAAPDTPGCQPKTLLAGGTDVMAQGWSLVMQSPAQLSNGPDYVKLQTQTSAGAMTSGQLLLSYPGAVEAGKPFKLQIVMLVESVNPHNSFDSAAAIMGSFAGGAGTPTDRAEMIYVDAGAIGWADDTQAFNAPIANNAYHTYELSVDASARASVTLDGTPALTRTGFTFNGAIAIGDQTNDASVDSVLRIRSVTRLCP